MQKIYSLFTRCVSCFSPYALKQTGVFLYTRAGESTVFGKAQPVIKKQRTISRGLALCTVVAVLSLVISLVYGLKNPIPTNATTTNTINFQARLESSNGAITPDGNYNVEFKLYSVSSGGAALWTEDYLNGSSQGIRVSNGYLTANLGSLTSFPSTIPWDQQLYLGMNIGGTAGAGTFPGIGDGEMNPRLLLTAVPYAFQAKFASSLQVTSGLNVATLAFTTPTANDSIVLPDASGIVCLNNPVNNCSFASSSGSGNYIQNGTSLQSSANFNIQSSGTGNVTATIQALTSQTADLLRFENTGGTGALSGINSGGQLYYQSGSFTGTLAQAALSANATYNLPNYAGTQTICTIESGNCGGTGGGITGSGTNHFVALFNSPSSINASTLLYDNGSFVGLGTITNSGLLSVVGQSTSQPLLFLQAISSATAASTVIKDSASQTGDLLDFQNSSGAVIASVDSSGNLTSVNSTATGNLNITGTSTFGGLASANGGLSLAANQNLSLASGTGTFSQTYSNGVSGTAHTLNVTNSNASSTSATVNGQNIALTGATNSNANANTVNGINFSNVTAITNNTFNGLNFGTGYTNVITGPNVTVSGTGVVSLGTTGTTNGQLILDSSTSGGSFTLQANGQSIATTLYLPTDPSSTDNVCLVTLANCGSSSGNSNYILNQTTEQTNANIYIGSRTGAVAASIQGASGQNILNLYSSGSSLVASVDQNGNFTGGTYNSQTISSAASFTGTVAVATGLTVSAGGINDTGNILQNGSGTFTTGSGNVTLNGATTANAGLTVAANQNLSLSSGTGTYSQTYSSGSSSAAATWTVTDSSASGTNTVNAHTIALAGTASSGSNTINGVNFSNISGLPLAGNTFNGLYFGTGYNSLLNYNGNSLINGSGILQNFAVSGTYSNLTGVGALATGSIATGFGAINTANNITTSQTIQGATFTNAASSPTFQVNSSGDVSLGNASNDGLLLLYNQTSSPNFITIDAASSASAATIHFPDQSGTVCLNNPTNNCGFASNSGSGAAFIQGGNAFGATGVLGTTDSNSLTIEAHSIVGITINTSGNTSVSGTLGVTGLLTASGGVTLPANQNLTLSSGTGTYSQTYSNGVSGNAHTVNVTNSNASSTQATVNGDVIALTGAINANSNANTINGINFSNVSAIANNSFNGLYFGTGYNSLLNYNGSSRIDGTGILQNAAIGSATNYTNLTEVGALVSGSIASGFGTINTANNITTTQQVQGGTFTNGGTFAVNSSSNITYASASSSNNTLVCQNGSGQLATCSSAILGGTAWILGGNTVGSSQILGTASGSAYGINIQTNGNTVESLSSTGSIVFQNSTNSTTALQVETSGGSPVVVLNVDTQNLRVGIGTASPNSQLQVTNISGTGVAVATIQGMNSQTGNLVNLNGTNASGTVNLASYDANGNFIGNGTNISLNYLSAPTGLSDTSGAGSSYYYVVTAVNAEGQSFASSYVGAVNNTGTLSWTAVAGATSYNVYRNTASTFVTGNLFLASATTNSYIDSGSATTAGIPPTAQLLSPTVYSSSPGTTYYYAVTSVASISAPTNLGLDNSGTTDYYGISAVNAYGQESTVASTGASNTSENIGWTPVAGAIAYNVYRNTSNVFTSANHLIGTTSVPSFYDNADSFISPSSAPPTLNASAQSPIVNTVGASIKTGILTWAAIAGATSYNIYRNTTNTFTSGNLYLGNTTSTSYTDGGSATANGLPPTSPSMGTLTVGSISFDLSSPIANISTPNSNTSTTNSIAIATGANTSTNCSLATNCFGSGSVSINTGNVIGNYGGLQSYSSIFTLGHFVNTYDYGYTANEPGNIYIDTGANTKPNFPTCPTNVGFTSYNCNINYNQPSIQIGTNLQNATIPSNVIIGSNQTFTYGTNSSVSSTLTVNSYTENFNGNTINLGSASTTSSVSISDNNSGADYLQLSGGSASLNADSNLYLSSLNGGFFLSGSAASTITNAGAITVTAAGASTWSTSSGQLIVQSGSGTLSLGTSTTLTNGGTTALTVTAGTNGFAVGQALNLDGGGSFNTTGGALNIVSGGTGTGAAGNVNINAGAGTANGAINIGTTNASNITITSGAASTWSTSTGLLTLSGANGLTLQAPTTKTITLDQSASGTETISLGTANATTLTIGRSGNTATTINGAAGSSITFGSVFGVAATTGNINAPQLTGNTTLIVQSASGSNFTASAQGAGASLFGTLGTGVTELGNTTGLLSLSGPNLSGASSGVCINSSAGSCGTLNTHIIAFDLNQSSATADENNGTNCTTTVNAGGMYYSAATASSNTTTQELRGCIDGSWTDIVTADQLGLIMLGVVPGTGTSNQGDIGGISGTNNGPCKVAWASTTSVTVNPCTAYSGGRKVVITSTVTISSLNGSNDTYNICLNGNNGAPIASTGSLGPTPSLPTFSVSAPILCLAAVTDNLGGTIKNISDTRVFVGDTFTYTTVNTAMAPGWIAIQSAANEVTATTSASAANVIGVIAVGNSSSSTTAVNAIMVTSGMAYVDATAATSSTFTAGNTAQTSTSLGYATQAATAAGYKDLGLVVNPPVNTACNAATNCQFSMLVAVSPH